MEICDLLKIGPNQLLAKLYAVKKNPKKTKTNKKTTTKQKKTKKPPQKPQNQKSQTTKNCCSYDKWFNFLVKVT